MRVLRSLLLAAVPSAMLAACMAPASAPTAGQVTFADLNEGATHWQYIVQDKTASAPPATSLATVDTVAPAAAAQAAPGATDKGQIDDYLTITRAPPVPPTNPSLWYQQPQP